MRAELNVLEVVMVEVVEVVVEVGIMVVMVAGGIVKLGVMVTEPWPVLVAPLSVAVDGNEPPPPPEGQVGS